MNGSDVGKSVSQKAKNKFRVLGLICAGDSVTRAYLTEMTGLSKMTITNIISELASENYIVEVEKKENTGTIQGRKPMIIDISPKAPYVVAIFICRNYCKLALCNLKGVVLKFYQFDLTGVTTVERFLNRLTSFYDLIVSGLDQKLIGIGISSIGPIDKPGGIILNPPNFYGLKNIRIKEYFEQRTGLPVYFDNNMNSSALAEKMFGYGRNLDNFIYLGVTHGVGAGVISDGRLLNDRTGINGEIGHTSINFSGPHCFCGNRGCLELYTSITTMVSKARQQMEKAGLIDAETPFDWDELVSNARAGEAISLRVLSEFCHYLAVGIVNLVNLFGCDAVFLGHEIARAAGLVERQLEELVNDNIFSRKIRKIEIKMSYFGENAPLIGSACNVLYRLYAGELC